MVQKSILFKNYCDTAFTLIILFRPPGLFIGIVP